MANLIVKKPSGEILFDTDKITYGLVKSGNMQFIQGWTRRYLRSAGLNPTNGANWTISVVRSDTSDGDGLWGFTVNNARSPIVFIHGSGCLNGTIKSGSSLTFLYSNASTSTRFYCFDLMSDSLQGSPYLKTYRESDGVITFNSLQPPLNIVSAISAPPPSPIYQAPNWRGWTYDGGRLEVRQQAAVIGGIRYQRQKDCIFDYPLSAGVLYATYLPWSRGASLVDVWSTDQESYAVIEGAYGRVGGISFIFGASAGTTSSRPPVGPTAPSGYADVPTDRYPIALSIDATNLPFPFN